MNILISQPPLPTNQFLASPVQNFSKLVVWHFTSISHLLNWSLPCIIHEWVSILIVNHQQRIVLQKYINRLCWLNIRKVNDKYFFHYYTHLWHVPWMNCRIGTICYKTKQNFPSIVASLWFIEVSFGLFKYFPCKSVFSISIFWLNANSVFQISCFFSLTKPTLNMQGMDLEVHFY